MQKGDAAAPWIVRLSYVTALVAVLGVAVLGVVYESRTRDAAAQRARADVLDRLSLLRSELQGRIDANVQLACGLVAMVSYQPEMDQAQFALLGRELVRGRPEVRNIAAVPDLVVKMIYPLAGNESVIGLDYRSRPALRHAAEVARRLGSTVLSGPVTLARGGAAFIARTPVFVGGDRKTGRFWGVVVSVIDRDALYRASGLTDPALDIDVALVAPNEGLANPKPFYGDPGVLEQRPVVTEVQLPFGSWQMAAVPKGGWQPPPHIWMTRLLFALAGVLVGGPIVAAAHFVASRQRRVALIRDREVELSRLSWRLEFALAASQVGVWDVDLESDTMIWDERAKALFGVSGRPGPFREADWMALVHPDDRARAAAEAREAVAENGRFVSQYRVLRPDGSIRHIRDMAAVQRALDGSRRLVGLVWDVTPAVEREEELNVKRLEAEAATVAKSRFLAAMSHEIRTPMSGVLGLLGLMLDDPLPEPQRERAQIALSSAENLLEILNDILDFSKLEAGQIRIAEESFDVRTLISDVIDLMAASAEQKGLALSGAIADAVPARITGDPMRLRQVLLNLISNAIKFTETGTIEVRADHVPAEDALHVEVEDTGIGIPAEQREAIFQRFVQADNSLTRRAGGTGLGLAISRQLVELMGGTIRLRSVPGMGSCFSFSVATGPAAQPAPLAASPEPAVAADAAPAMRVLLAEDHATNQYLLKAYLQKAGHEVVVVGNGAEAVAAAGLGGFDAILMDVQMPELDGLAATRAIRGIPGTAGAVPIIALTASAMPGDRENCEAAGMTDYLSKPVVVAALHRALGRAATGGPAGPGEAAQMTSFG